METALIILTISLLLLPACTEARLFPTGDSLMFPSSCNGFISTVTDLENKNPKSPPSPKSEPSNDQGTNDEPAKQAPASVSQLESMVFNSGKIPKSPPPPSPAPSKHQATNGQPAPPSKCQGTIEQPTERSSWTPDFQFNSIAADLGKTGRSPPSPNPAPRKGQEIIEQQIQQRSSQDFQVASS